MAAKRLTVLGGDRGIDIMHDECNFPRSKHDYVACFLCVLCSILLILFYIFGLLCNCLMPDIRIYTRPQCALFHSMHSSKVTPDPPNISKALPIVRSTFP